ncbi:flagellar hook-length control protein FliK [Bacillus sp. V5-8f]|uniref:flagellar hook-length control protein FliK n=1 Tax=Bacillus sp. V5-8f TaxID=2053044 RepID=UPI000C762B12|nr:flagellar hook-length control protein FliK [Bacillus sp. V5-8f]PLT34209.1 hypothetical protein CUU64_08225 [Bacillus sp. V5-8f]
MNAGIQLPRLSMSSTTSSGNPVTIGTNGKGTGFGAVLSALSKGNLPTNSESTGLSTEQTDLLQQLVQFLQVGNLSELDGVDGLGKEMMLEGMDVQNLADALLNANVMDETLLNKLSTEQTKLLEELEKLFPSSDSGVLAGFLGLSSTGKLNGNIIDEKLLNKLIDSLKESGHLKETHDEITGDLAFMSFGSMDLISIIKALAGMNEEQLLQVDLNTASNVLKFAKIQELLSAYKDLSSEEGVMAKEMKNLLQQVAEKFKQILDADAQNNSRGTAFSRLTGNDTTQNIALLKGVYERMAKDFNSANSSVGKNAVSEAANMKQLDINQSQPQFFQISKLEQFVLSVEKSGQPVNQEQFIKAFENILSKANFANGNGMQKLFIKLNPEHLGSLRIEIIQKDAILTAKIMATSAKAKELLESQLQGLKHAFNGQNLQVEKIEVSQTLNSFTQDRFLQRDSDGSEQQDRGKNQQETSQEQSEAEFTEDLEAALLNAKV